MEHLIEVIQTRYVYDPSTGIFTHKSFSKFHERFAGQRACRFHKSSGYMRLCINHKYYGAHRAAFAYMLGHIPSLIDHANGDPTDNRWSNLRAATSSQNACNSMRSKEYRSAVRGTCLHKQTGKWQAAIRCGGKNIYLGLFEDQEEAGSVYEQARTRLHGEFRRDA